MFQTIRPERERERERERKREYRLQMSERNVLIQVIIYVKYFVLCGMLLCYFFVCIKNRMNISNDHVSDNSGACLSG